MYHLGDFERMLFILLNIIMTFIEFLFMAIIIVISKSGSSFSAHLLDLFLNNLSY